MNPIRYLTLVILFGLGTIIGAVIGTMGRVVVVYVQPETVPVLVAVSIIPEHTLLGRNHELVTVKQFLKGTEPADAVTETDELRFKAADRLLRAGQPITKADLRPDLIWGWGGEPGLRAVTVRAIVEDQRLLLPGVAVDVLASVTTEEGKQITRMLLQNAVVLTTGFPGQTANGRSTLAVTLGVKPEDAERVYWVTSRTDMMLMIRMPGDDAEVKTKGVTDPLVKPEK